MLVIHVLAEGRPLRLRQCLGSSFVIKRRFGRAHGLHELRARARRLAHDVELGLAPMRRHLPPTRAWVVLRAHRRKKHFHRRHAKHQAQWAVAVVGINPVHSGPQEQAHRRANRFVPGAGNLKIDFVLPFELNLAVVQPARKEHRAINSNQRVVIEAVNLGGVKLCQFDARL